MVTKVINSVTGQEGILVRRTKCGITVQFGPYSWDVVELSFHQVYLNMYAHAYMVRG